MKPTHIAILTGLFSFSLCSAQGINFVSMGQSVDGAPIMLEYSVEDNDYKIEGSPFLFEDWQEVKIKRDNGALFKAEQGNYHIYLGELIVSLNNTYQRLHDSKQIDWFEVNGEKHIRIDNAGNSASFAKLLVDTDKLQLLKLYTCFIQKGKPNQGIVEATPDKYVRLESYIIRQTSDYDKATELKPKRKGAKLKDESDFSGLVKYLGKNGKEDFRDEVNMIRILSEF